MGIFKLDYVRRQPWIGDYNRLVDAVNRLIDKAQEKKEVVSITIEREIKDYSFFLWNEVALPYEASSIILTPEDATEIFSQYAFTYKEVAQINKAITEWKVVALEIKVKELITEKEKKQETAFETIETISKEELSKPKKKGRPKKKSSWN